MAASVLVGSARINIQGKDDQFVTTMRRVGREFDKQERKMRQLQRRTRALNTGFTKLKAGLLGLASGVGIGVGLTATVRQMNQAAEAAGEFGSTLQEIAQGSGVTVEALQAIRFAFESDGISAEKADRAIGRVARAFGDVTNLKTYQRAFEQIGVDWRGLQTQGASVEQVFRAVADGVATTEDKFKVAASAAQLLGRDWQQAVKAFSEGSKGLDTALDKLEKLGLLLSAKDSALLKDMTQLLSETEKWRNVQIARTVAENTEAFVASAKASAELEVAWTNLVMKAAPLLKVITGLVEKAEKLIDLIPEYEEGTAGPGATGRVGPTTIDSITQRGAINKVLGGLLRDQSQEQARMVKLTTLFLEAKVPKVKRSLRAMLEDSVAEFDIIDAEIDKQRAKLKKLIDDAYAYEDAWRKTGEASRQATSDMQAAAAPGARETPTVGRVTAPSTVAMLRAMDKAKGSLREQADLRRKNIRETVLLAAAEASLAGEIATGTVRNLREAANLRQKMLDRVKLEAAVQASMRGETGTTTRTLSTREAADLRQQGRSEIALGAAAEASRAGEIATGTVRNLRKEADLRQKNRDEARLLAAVLDSIRGEISTGTVMSLREVADLRQGNINKAKRALAVQQSISGEIATGTVRSLREEADERQKNLDRVKLEAAVQASLSGEIATTPVLLSKTGEELRNQRRILQQLRQEVRGRTDGERETLRLIDEQVEAYKRVLESRRNAEREGRASRVQEAATGVVRGEFGSALPGLSQEELNRVRESARRARETRAGTLGEGIVWDQQSQEDIVKVNDGLAQTEREIGKIAEQMRQWEDLQHRSQDGFAGIFAEIGVGRLKIDDLSQAFLNLAQDIGYTIIKQQILNALMQSFGGFGGFGGVGAPVSGGTLHPTPVPGLAAGGNVHAGTAYRFNEFARQDEIFVPRMGGRIQSAYRGDDSGPMEVVFAIDVDARGQDGPAAEAAALRAFAKVRPTWEASLADKMHRPGRFRLETLRR